MTIRRAYCDFEHGQLHYRTNGSPQSSRHDLPLLLLHQSPSDSRMYAALMRELQEDYWLIAPDNPGFGSSDALAEGFSLAGCVSAIESLLAHLQIESCLVFGHHTGASIAVQLAAGNPELVHKLALSGPTLLDAAMQESLPGKAASIAPVADGSHLAAMWQRMAGKQADAPAGLLLRETMSALAAGDNYQQAYAAVCEQDFAGQLQALQCPTLVFAGSSDILYPQLQGSYELLRDGRKAEIVGAGSYLCESQVAQVASLIRDFYGEDRSPLPGSK